MIGEGQGQNGAVRERTCYREVRREPGNLRTPHQRAGLERRGRGGRKQDLGPTGRK